MSSQGRLSELFGLKALHIDKYIRNLGLLESAKRINISLDGVVREYF